MIETPVLFFETALFAIAFFCTIVATLVLLSSKDGRSPANRYLVFYLLAVSCVNLMLFLIISKLIVHVPWLYRLPSPLYYLMFPAAFFYVRMVLMDETQLRKTDYLHALPAVIHLVEMLPFYLSSDSYKVARILADSSNPLAGVAHAEGWLPAYMHNYIRGYIGIIYAFFMMRLLWQSRVRRPIGRRYFPAMNSWLWVFSLMVMLFPLSVVITFSIPGPAAEASRSVALYLMVAATQIVTGLYLLLNPEILYGMPRLEKLVGRVNHLKEEILLESGWAALHAPETGSQPLHSGPLPQEQGDQPSALPEEPVEMPVVAEGKRLEPKGAARDYEDYITMLQHVMHNHKPFLRKRYSLHDLATDVKIPQHHLSYLLNNVFQVRFTDYINQWRIQYIQERLATEDLSHLTLEGLALEAGFSSRITFIRVVQKHTGMNPSAYFKARGKGDDTESDTVTP